MNQVPKILIVDDERANQFLLEGLLKAHNYHTSIAGDGDECLKLLETERPDLILLDIMMPRVSGIEVLKRIVNSEELNRIPVIMVSAKTSTSDIKKALEIGAIDYIRKPFEEVDLLARVNAGIRLKNKEDHLRELIAQREDFVRIISHDLRSPFIAISGFAEMLLSDENLNDDQKRSLQQIIDSVEFSQEYFNKLLSWAKLEQQEIELNKKQYNLAKMVLSTLRIQEKKAHKKNIQISIEVDPALEITVDEIFFRQVIENLVSNAIKFTPVGGTIQCLSDRKEDSIRLIISDNGIGMPADISPDELFSRAFVPSRRGTNSEKGTGIGLGICKKILDAHKFKLSYTANNKGGTDFIITMNI